jgi:hypothetical protein
VVGSFQVQNIGDAGSLLNWTINTSSISWGTWTYNPPSGENLTPEAGPKTVQVTVVAPEDGNTNFEGYVRVENLQDLTDFDLIPVSLKTSTDTHTTQGMLHQKYLGFLSQHFFSSLLLLLETVFKNHTLLLRHILE